MPPRSPSRTFRKLLSNDMTGGRVGLWLHSARPHARPVVGLVQTRGSKFARFSPLKPIMSSGGATICPQGQFKAEYYNNTALNGVPATTRCESAINYDWGTSEPGTGVGGDHFSVRWTGTHDFAEAGDYTFSTTADDGVRVWVDGKLIIDQWKDQSATTYTASVPLTAGEHQVKMEYYEAYVHAVAVLQWG